MLRPSRYRVKEIIREHLPLTDSEERTMEDCVSRSIDVWLGTRDDEVYCVWGVVPPTILSQKAYLWLYTNEEKIAEHQFTFIRWSQIAVKKMLDDFEVLYGVTDLKNEKTIRWLKWLGAEFDQYAGQLHFEIRRK